PHPSFRRTIPITVATGIRSPRYTAPSRLGGAGGTHREGARSASGQPGCLEDHVRHPLARTSQASLCPWIMSMKPKVVAAGVFKQGCLGILDDVAATQREVIITKRGRPVARVLPMVSDREREEELLAHLRGKARMLVPEDEFLAPLTQEAG